MREYVTVLRDALAGRAVFAGSYYRVAWEGAFRARAAPPILVAALSRAMLELAGEIADGAVLWLCSPEYVRGVAIPALTRGRTRGGRPWTGFEVVAAVPLAVAPSGWTTFRQELVRYLELPFYRAMLRASGFEEDISAFDRDAARRPKAEAIPRRLVEALGMVGDPALLRAYVERYRAAGVTLPAVRPIGGADAEDARQVLEAAAP
jgi:alkanesulfonate monooxygenase SsuD/methylene tetrahydromethanopterin reductase-like flavin-dependent oxidoreductase (luciferase family)